MKKFVGRAIIVIIVVSYLMVGVLAWHLVGTAAAEFFKESCGPYGAGTIGFFLMWANGVVWLNCIERYCKWWGSVIQTMAESTKVEGR